MLDLGTSFVASAERDPDALAIVDGEMRLTYGEWVPRIAAVAAGLDSIGLRRGDRLLTLLQNRWQTATLHWACQISGVIITPLNCRAKADEVDYCIADAEVRAIAYEEASAEAVRAAAASRALPRLTLAVAGEGEVAFDAMAAMTGLALQPRATA